MKKPSCLVWICSIIVAVVAVAVWRFYPVEKFEVVSIEAIVEERKQFEEMHPLNFEADNIADREKLINDLRERNRSYAEHSQWNGKTIVVHGYWNSPFEGFSISNKTSDQDEKFLLMKPAPDFKIPRSTFSRYIPSFFQNSAPYVRQDDCVKITGVYRATGYKGHWGLMDSVEWLEFHQIERWDQARQRWQRVYSWY